MRQHVRSFQLTPVRIFLALAFAAISLFGSWLDARAYESLPSGTPDFPSIIQPHADRLAKLESDKDAIALFVTAIGPALQQGDAARTLGANALPAKVAKELLVPDLTAATHRLIGSLAAWHLASAIREAVKDRQLTSVTERLSKTAKPLTWLAQQDKASWHSSLIQLSDAAASLNGPMEIRQR